MVERVKLVSRMRLICILRLLIDCLSQVLTLCALLVPFRGLEMIRLRARNNGCASATIHENPGRLESCSISLA